MIYAKTAHELHQLLIKGEISSKEVVSAVLERIDGVETDINAYITINEEALAQAERADRMIRDGKATPLTGIPVAVKDNMSTKGIRTTCASNMLKDYVPPYNATAVEKLIEAGAIIIGKTNLDEFAMGSSCENSAFKQTKNPWDLSKVPGGSSGGSAAAVAAGEAIMALGSDTGGSIRQPAAFTGVVGLKPTYGRVSRYGLVAFASSLDQIGPFARDVEDAANLLSVISGHDSLDSTSIPGKESDFSLDGASVKGLRVGIPKEFMTEGLDPVIRDAINRAAQLLEDEGASVKECSLPHSEYALSAYYIIAPAEASSNLARFDGVRYGLRVSGDNHTDMFIRSRQEGFGPEVKRRIMLGTYALSAGYYDAYYKKALQVRNLIKQDFDHVFADFDVILSPTTPSVAFGLGEKVDDPLSMYLSDVYTIPVNMAGLPGLSLPFGFNNGLPIGVQLIGGLWQERKLLQVGKVLEQATGYVPVVPERGDR